MKISIKRTGGYAGITEDLGTIDTDQLNGAVAQQIKQMIQAINFFNLPTTVPQGGAGADLFSYEITVTEGNQQHTVIFNDDGNPENAAIRQFIEFVIKRG